GVAGEIAHDRLSEEDGNATYRNYIIDAIFNMDGAKLDAMAKYEEIK
ncbi:MAG: hydroxyethylthiazole kinase, partial [Lachnospiraceae bacterium]|nr:hydroxyethylthiazole kinase [Lachnospiraceae bacterium]